MATPLNKKLGDSASLLHECEAIEEELARLRAHYEQYFMGLERRLPDAKQREVKGRINSLRTAFVQSPAVRFRIQSLWTKYAAYERLWARSMREIEEGTHRRDLHRLKQRKRQQPAASAKPTESSAPATAGEGAPVAAATPLTAAASAAAPSPPKAQAVASAVAATSPAPAAAKPVQPAGAKPPGGTIPVPGARRIPVPSKPAAGGDGLSDEKVRSIYEAYVSAKKTCNEDTSKMSFDAVAQNIRKQVPELLKRHNAQTVEFKVVIKDGKAQLRAVPK